jgi:hypothetical protein
MQLLEADKLRNDIGDLVTRRGTLTDLTGEPVHGAHQWLTRFATSGVVVPRSRVDDARQHQTEIGFTLLPRQNREFPIVAEGLSNHSS